MAKVRAESGSDRKPLALVALLALACGPASWSAEHPTARPKRVTADLGCRSGLRVIFEATPASNVATVVLMIDAGARRDPAGQEGLAHLVEHLAFRASEVRQAKSGDLTVLGVDDRGTTDHDSVDFTVRGPVSSVEAMLKEQAAKLSNPLGGVTPTVFEVERNIVRNELRERFETDVKGQASAWHLETLFAAPHPYHRRVIGTHESLAAISLGEAREWTADYYRPDSATMVVTGALDTKDIESLVEELPPGVCGGLVRPFRPSVRKSPTFSEVEENGPTPLVHRTGEVVAPELWVGWRVPRLLDPARQVADVWTELLQEHIKVATLDDDDVTSVECFGSAMELGSYIGCRLGLATAVHPAGTATSLKNALRDLGAKLADHLPRTKRTMKIGEAYLTETPWVRAQDRGWLAHVSGVFDAGAYDPQSWQAVSIEMLQTFQRKYLAPELGRATLVEPSAEAQRASPRSPADTRAAAPDLHWNTYTPSALDELAQIRFMSGLSTTTLPNGLQLVTVTRRHAPIVTSAVGFRVAIGDEAASIAADDAMKTILDSPPPDSGLILGSLFAERYVSMSAAGGPEDLDAAISSLARAVRRYDVEWPSPKSQNETIPRLRVHDATPATRAYRELASKLFGAHPLGRHVAAGDVAALSKKQIVDFLQRTIAPQNGILIVVGDVRPAQALAAVRREFLDWPRTAGSGAELPPPLRPDSPPATPAARLAAPAVVARPGASQVEISLGCLLPPSNPALDARYDLTADVLRHQMHYELRTTLGASYSVQTTAQPLVGGTTYLWMGTAIGNDELPAALKAMRAYWRDVSAGSRPTNSVRSEQIARMQAQIFDLERSAKMAGLILGTWLLRWPLDEIDQSASHIQAVGTGDVDGVLRRCAERLFVVMAGDPGVIKAAIAK